MKNKGVILLSSIIYERLSKMSKSKLDDLEYNHNKYYVSFTNAKDSKVNQIQKLTKEYSNLTQKAKKELESSIPNALGTAMEMKQTKAEILIAKSVLTVLRSNQFYNRLMMMLAQDIKSGVKYDQNRVSNLIPSEFSELIEESVLSTNMDGVLRDLKIELDRNIGEN